MASHQKRKYAIISVQVRLRSYIETNNFKQNGLKWQNVD